MHILKQSFLDTNSNLIQAHGGCMLFHEGTYYWYGENKNGKTIPSKGCDYRVDFIGISCYSSVDLTAWKYEGLVMEAINTDMNGDLHPSRTVERPKVIYNTKTKQFIMWLHIDNEEYTLAKAGIAIADNPLGPFKFCRSFYPNNSDSRDLTLFKDTDETAYLIHSSDWNKTLYISKLTEDYLDLTGEYKKCFIDQCREAPVVFKKDHRYYMITSGCTGWYPNPALFAQADEMFGNWIFIDNPCVGYGKNSTFGAQGAFSFTENDTVVFCADIWNPKDLGRSTYLWLNINFENCMPVLSMENQFNATEE